jgi:hypothetical protein
LPPSESLHLVRGEYDVNGYYQAFRNDEAPEMSLERAPSAVAVYRIGFALWRMNLTPAMAGLLEALMKGATLEEALAGVGEAVSTPDELAEAERQVMGWFRAWVTSGFFARVEPT